VRPHLREVGQCLADRDSQVFSVIETTDEMRAGQQGFRRDTAVVQAQPADMLSLHQSNPSAQLSGAQRCGVTSGPAAEND